MLLALIWLVAAGPVRERWTCSDEVYGLALHQGEVHAATSGGVINVARGSILPQQPPGEIRAVGSSRGALWAGDSEGRMWVLNGTDWVERGSWEQEPKPAVPAPMGSGGAFMSATCRFNGTQLVSFWGSKKLYASIDNGLEPALPRPPAPGDYCLLQDKQNRLLAGTPDGLFALEEDSWSKVALPSQLPFSRVHGLAALGQSRWLVAGIKGAQLGSPSKWERVSNEPVRQLLHAGDEIWLLYGSGSIDKVDTKSERLFYDVLHEAAKRPWGSCLAKVGRTVLIGSEGGWIEKGKSLVEHYPRALATQVVTALAGSGDERWIGTQKQGLFFFGNGKLSQIGPPAKLGDTWVTSVFALGHGRALVATSSAGLLEVSERGIKKFDSPSARPRWLAKWRGNLVIGALDGCWVKERAGWKRLSTAETTGLTTVGNDLWLLEPTGATRLR